MKSSAAVYILHIGILLCDLMQAAPFSNDSYIEEYEGKRVTLVCWKESATKPTDIDWMKKIKNAADERVATKLLSGWISYFREWDTGQVTLQDDYSLKIDRLTYPRDQGTFVCNGFEISAVTVNILSNPKDVQILGSWMKQGVRYLNVTHSQPITLGCSTKGGKAPSSYRWRLGDRDITRTSFQQNLTYIFNKSDNGQLLKCIIGGGTEGSVRLNVHYAPSTPAMISNKGLGLEVIEDEDIIFKCESSGNPVPSITWLRDEQIIGHGNEYTINKANRSVAGTYTCQASNEVDVAENHKQLVVKYPPAVSLVYRPEHKQLTCEASNGHPQHYSFEPWTHKVNGREFPTEGISRKTGKTLVLDVSNVTYRSSGDYFCYVTNGVKGRQTSTKEIQAISAPAFAKQPRVFKGKVSESLDILIRFWSNPSPQIIKWRKKGEGNKHGPWVSGTIRKKGVQIDMEFTDFLAPLKGYEAVLTLQTFEEADAGLYTVLVENAQGFATYDIEIIIEGDDVALTLISMLCAASLIIMFITLKVLVSCGVISCPDCKCCKRTQAPTPERTAKHPDFDTGQIRHADPPEVYAYGIAPCYPSLTRFRSTLV
ncbi:hemicentin-1-like isoform X2 [Liolophura sinensis]|uniref:hemicentin-1-like isoform X2 n=1 Tax=Liolophura sinensis TaxID=3198878 RepID=UPI00315953E0